MMIVRKTLMKRVMNGICHDQDLDQDFFCVKRSK